MLASSLYDGRTPISRRIKPMPMSKPVALLELSICIPRPQASVDHLFPGDPGERLQATPLSILGNGRAKLRKDGCGGAFAKQPVVIILLKGSWRLSLCVCVCVVGFVHPPATRVELYIDKSRPLITLFCPLSLRVVNSFLLFLHFSLPSLRSTVIPKLPKGSRSLPESK